MCVCDVFLNTQPALLACLGKTAASCVDVQETKSNVIL